MPMVTDTWLLIGTPVLIVGFGVLYYMKVLSLRDFGFWVVASFILLGTLISAIELIQDGSFGHNIATPFWGVLAAFQIGRILRWFEVRRSGARDGD